MWNSSDYVASIHLFDIASSEKFLLSNIHLIQSYEPVAFFSSVRSIWWVLVAWILLEIAFATILYFFVLPDLHQLKVPTPYHGDIVQMMKRTLDQVKVLDSYTFDMYLRGFFNQAQTKNIYLDNYRSFLSWCMFHKHLEELSNVELTDLSEILEYTKQLHPEVLNLKPGFNPKIGHCRMTLEPLPMIHRPLLLYALVNFFESMSNGVFLHACGFQRLEEDGAGYWYKKQGNDEISSGREPLVILHGISTGWMVYMAMVRSLGEHRTLVLVDVDAVKVKSLNFDMPTPQRFVDRVVRILDRHEIPRASFVGHSFGSITAGWFVRYFPERVSHLTLIDPVSILLGLPNVAYSFLYRKPSSLVEWIIYLGAGQEVTVSYALRRHFFWYNNNLWLEDIPAHIGVVVGVSSNDEIIDAAAVQEYTLNCRAARLAQQQQQQQQQQQHAPRGVPLSQTQDQAADPHEESGPQRRVTRSMGSSQPAPLQKTREGLQNGAKGAPRWAKIECVKWEGFSHGQVLVPTSEQQQFIELIHSNEVNTTK